MFKLENNKLFENGVCTYIDIFGNTVFVKREKEKITFRLRFIEYEIKADPFIICFPIDESQNGDTLHLNYSDEEKLKKESVTGAIESFTTLINHWISMQYDINLLDAKNFLFQKANPTINELNSEDISRYKISRLMEYEELREFLQKI